MAEPAPPAPAGGLKLPLWPTIVVGLAVATMIGLGLWQLLDRLPAKEAYLAQLAQNPGRPEIAVPRVADDSVIFRRSRAICLEPVKTERAGAGKAGFRLIVTCRTGIEGPGLLVQLGTTRDPNGSSNWRGGEVVGYISHAPDSRPLLATLFDRNAKPLMLVADTPPPGLAPNERPNLGAVPNNHLAYAGQWFFFAAAAALIYLLALRRRRG